MKKITHEEDMIDILDLFASARKKAIKAIVATMKDKAAMLHTNKSSCQQRHVHKFRIIRFSGRDSGSPTWLCHYCGKKVQSM